jgi:hypothetical protein
MSHTDLHAKTENLVKQPAASKQTYNNLKNGSSKPTTADETQTLTSGPRYCTVYKGALTGSHIYERMHPDGQTKALRIDGPADGFFALNNLGTIIVVSGKRTKERGPGSGKLNFHSYGGTQQKHESRSNYEYSAGDDPEKQALNIICYGDVIEDAKGSQRTIKASKIMIEATGELYLKGQNVIIDANGGSGSIQMFSANFEQTTSNKKEIVKGQLMKYGVSEETTIQFDPRSSVNVVTPGHVNHKVLGDYQQWIGGAFQKVVVGGLPVPPLIKTRDNVYTVKTTGPQIYQSTAGIAQVATGSVSVTAGGAFSANAGGKASLTGGSSVAITSADKIDIIGVGNVKIKGALIYLN